MIEHIGADFVDLISTQCYEPGPEIHGVKIVDVPVASDEAGDFCEIARFVPAGRIAGMSDVVPAQISYSSMEPGAIKAWHLHFRQDDLWFVPPAGKLLVGMLDLRTTSPSYRTVVRRAMGAGRARLLYIPRGVAHGVANVGPSSTPLIYLVTEAFNRSDPDERRLPYDLMGADFWKVQPG